MKEAELLQMILSNMRSHAQNFTHGDESDGFVISGLIHIVANLYDNIHTNDSEDGDLSVQRIGILIRLLEQERRGNTEGLTPTDLSKGQHVSRNTISSLLRGLEDQGLIERQLDAKDRRLFHIHITETGRSRVRILAPDWIAKNNALAAELTPEERAQLITLLGKLFSSLHEHAHACPTPLKTGAD